MTSATFYETESGAAWITLNRPDRRNALSADLVNELYEHLLVANADDAVRCIVLTGAGSAFCAGADLKNPPGGEPVRAGGQARSLPDVLELMLNSPKPLVCAINGAAFAGGLGLVGACDIVVAVEDAPFSFSEVRIGVIPAIISVVCVPKLGVHNAMKLFITGERFTGTQAVEMGLVHQAVPAPQLRSAVESIITMINLGGPIAVQECKKLVRRVSELTVKDGFAETASWSARMFRSPEASEGMAAFREKRQPIWVEKGNEEGVA